jgi:hypothetical protein
MDTENESVIDLPNISNTRTSVIPHKWIGRARTIGVRLLNDVLDDSCGDKRK